jgi:hypothetical protein
MGSMWTFPTDPEYPRAQDRADEFLRQQAEPPVPVLSQQASCLDSNTTTRSKAKAGAMRAGWDDAVTMLAAGGQNPCKFDYEGPSVV